MARPYYKEGTWNAECAVCGFEFKADKLQKDWRGLYVGNKDFEPRNVLDFYRPPPPERGQATAWSQHIDREGDGLDVETITVTPNLLVPSLTDVNHLYNSTFGGTADIELAAADSTAYMGSISVILTFTLASTSQPLQFKSLVAGQMTSFTLTAGETAKVQNLPSFSQWIRVF